MRDMLFLKTELKNSKYINELIIMTSSPRRRYALETNLADLIPISFSKINFIDIRGNIDTRLKKFMAGEAHGIVIAKAAIDRILEYEKINNISTSPIQTCLKASQWMVLPLSLFPSAPGQGAIGIEVANKNNSLIDLVHSISEKKTFDNVVNERKIMSKYGGGCSQKIGVSIWGKNNLKIKSINGLTEDGEVLKDFTTISTRLSEPGSSKTTIKSNAFPVAKNEKNIFSRKFLDKNTQIGKIKNSIIYITRKTVLKNKPAFAHSCILITSGIKTWRESVRKGYWINGSTDSMGQSELDQLELITKRKDVIKLSFKDNSSKKTDTIDLYELLDPKFPEDFEKREEYFWMSSFAFSVALERYPAIIKKRHASGMGNTYNKIKKLIGQDNEITPYLSYEHWLKSLKD
jgi:hydroxymethylbilane synthase